MADFTKKAIKQTFIALLETQELSKISVVDITKRCGINRNSFYYHFRSIPALIEEIVEDYFDEAIAVHPEINSLGELFDVVVDYCLHNKAALLHIYDSVNRNIFERFLSRYCHELVDIYIETAYSDKTISPAEKERLKNFIACAAFGLCLEWLNSGMNEEKTKSLRQTLTLGYRLTPESAEKIKAVLDLSE